MSNSAQIIGEELPNKKDEPIEEEEPLPTEFPATEEQVKDLIAQANQATPTPATEMKGL